MTIAVRPVDADWAEANLPALGAILHACVRDGASVSFLADLTPERAADFWHAKLPAIRSGDAALIVAFRNDAPCGAVMVIRAGTDNQPHRGDIAKLLVHPNARGGGVGRALMDAAEAQAAAMGLSLLVLDTASAHAARIYRESGWIEVGKIPDYALDIHGRPEATTLFYKRLQDPVWPIAAAGFG